MAYDAAELSPAAIEMLGEYHLATLATVRADGSPHVVAVGFTYDPEERVARVITLDGSQKVRNVERAGHAVLTHVGIGGFGWLTLEGPARISREPERVADAERRYAARYRTPQPNPQRVVIEMAVTRALGSEGMFAAPGPAARERS